jgi:hypothetical protein
MPVLFNLNTGQYEVIQGYDDITTFTTTVATTAPVRRQEPLTAETLENAIRLLREQTWYYAPPYFYYGQDLAQRVARPRQDYLKLINRPLTKRKSNHQSQAQKRANQKSNIFQDVLRYVAGKG